MATPGTEVEELPEPIIGFGAGADRQKYGGYAYSLDFNLSLIDPIRLSVSFISEDRKYDFTELQEDIADNGVKNDPTLIRYCEDKKFWGYPLKYSVNRSPRGDILTVDFYDASITSLDNTFVLLNKEDIPIVSEGVDESKCLNYEFISKNPCPERSFNVGSPYVKKGAGFPDANPACTPPQGQEMEVLYSNTELAALITEHIPVDTASLKALTHHKGPDGKEEAVEFLENFHGTLRQVLKSWGERMGFTFYWDSERGEEFGELVLINLTDGLFYSSLKETVDLMLGSVSGGACNLLDSTEALSMEQTFNKAISANYTNSSMGQATDVDNLMLLDLFTLPVRGCVTDKGLSYPPGEYDGYIPPGKGVGFLDGSPQYRWWANNGDWYKEWDNPQYHPKGDASKRKWLEYEPKRPRQGEGETAVAQEFRDYVRLVKAAALGQDFFKAYVFFKTIKSSQGDLPERTLLDFAQEHFILTNGGDQVGCLECKAAVQLVYSMGLYLKGFEPAGVGDRDEKAFLRAICGRDDAEPRATFELMESRIVINPKGSQSGDNGVTAREKVNGDSLDIIPNLVENKALTKILSSDAAGENPTVGTPNIKICRGTVLGKNCLTVSVLDPSYSAVQFLYRQSGNQVGPCGGVNEALSIEIVDEAKDVWRILGENKNEDAAQNADKAEKNGHPYIFTYTHQYGNSMVLGDQQHNALFRQLKTVAENAGRWYVSPELITEREFNQRSYSEKDITWVNKLLDVNDTSFRGIFQEFDPLAASSLKNWSDDEDQYNEFWGTPFNKGSDSSQKQLNYYTGEEGPDDPLLLSNPCEYNDGSPFNPSASKTGENGRAPNIEQMIQKIIEKTLKNSTSGDCFDDVQMSEISDLVDATFELTPDQLDPYYNEDGELVGYTLKSNYYNGEDFSGGFGYSMAVNGNTGPKIDFGNPAFSIKPIIVNNVIEEIVIENPQAVVFAPDALEQFDVIIDPPAGGEINFFKELKADTSMENMDSIRSENLNLRNRQRQLSCCCTDLEEGVVLHDAGEQLTVHFSSRVQKQIQRLSRATNIPISSDFGSNLVKDYKKDNKVITYSTNLIPIADGDNKGLDGTAAPYAQDELDWIVDQIQIGGEGMDPAFESTFYGVPTNFIIPSLTCSLPVKSESFLKSGDPFSITVLAIPELEQDGDGFHDYVVKTLTNPDSSKRIIDCAGFLGENGVNAREMQIEFVSPTSDDLQVEFECGKTWADLSTEEKNELMCNIQSSIIEFARKRAYLVNRPSYEASVTVADVCLLDNGGGKVRFGDGNNSGIPNIDQGLESLSIKIDGNGQRVSFSVGTRKKLMSLRDPNADLWREINPRTANWLQPNVGQQ